MQVVSKLTGLIDRLTSPDKFKGRRRRAEVFAVAVTTLISIPAALSFKVMSGTPFVKLPSLTEQGAGIAIYDLKDDYLVTAHKDTSHQPVPLERVSAHMRNAIIAGEDKNFLKHPGIDPIGIMRAFISNVKAGEIVQGGSTITQQLVKSLYLDKSDRTITRKAIEALMAIDVDMCYSKDKILETYLNEIYFGRGAYGIERAAGTYFNKPASRLDIAESAFLAGLVKAPSQLGSSAKRASALDSQKEVLKSMVECGFITEDEERAARTARLKFQKGPHPLKHPYYVLHVLDVLRKKMGEESMWRRPIKVYTNLDQDAQRDAERVLARGIRKAPAGVDQGALVSMSISDGAVIAMVGGAGPYESNQWNRAIHPHTTGSAFKPFVYLAGLITDSIGPHSVLNDAPIAVPISTPPGIYTPRNFDGAYLGRLTVRDALALSRNVCAVSVAEHAGIENVIDTARYAGITSPIDPYPSLALGTCAASPLEMASAYATIARSGLSVEPSFVRRVEDWHGRVIERFKPRMDRMLPEEPCRQIVDAMQDVVTRGTGKKARLNGIPVAGKTGTADRARDIWFIGFTPEVVTAVWGGNDDNRPVAGSHVTGGSIMAAIWNDYMISYHRTHQPPQIAFSPPANPLDRTMYIPPFTAFFDGAIGFAEEIDETMKEAEKANRTPHTLWRKFIKVFKKLF